MLDNPVTWHFIVLVSAVGPFTIIGYALYYLKRGREY